MLSKIYRHLSIRSQILIVVIAPTLIMTLILVVLAYRENMAQSHQALRRQGDLLAAQLAANLEYPLLTGATEQIPAVIQAMVEPAAAILGTEVKQVTVIGKDQQILYADPRSPVPEVAPLNGGLLWLRMLSPKIDSTFLLPSTYNRSRCRRWLPWKSVFWGRSNWNSPQHPCKTNIPNNF